MNKYRYLGLLLVCGLPVINAALAQAEPASADTVTSTAVSAQPSVPELDVVGNVRRMLEESRGQGDVPGGAPPSVHEPAVRQTAEDEPPKTALPVIPSDTTVPTAPPPAQRSEAARAVVAAPGPKRPAATDSSHVPLPEKEITIRSLDDLRVLKQELDKAKAEKAQR